MLLVKPSATILAMTPDPLCVIEAAGRTCYKSEDKIGCTRPGIFDCGLDCPTCSDHTSHAFAKMILKRGHESVLEHASATVRFICDRGVSHEIVRHRIASYSQESTRYCGYEGGHVAFVIPPWVDIEPGEYSFDRAYTLPDEATAHWFAAVTNSEYEYQNIRRHGWRPEQARSVLPNSLKTEVVMTANLREWRHFFKLRTAAAAHPQMREVAIPLLAEFQAAVPVIFDEGPQNE